jgi:hypothetical protein
MTEVLHANIFFFIASMATVVFCIIVSMVLYQVYKIMYSIRLIVSRIEMQSGQIAEDIDAMRTFVRRGSFVSTLFNFFTGQVRGRRRSSRSTENNDSNE